MTGSLSILDHVVIIVFFAVMVVVGAYWGRRTSSSAQFFGSDKTVPWWLSGISFYMNSFSALAFVMYSALAYKYGWVPVTVSWLSVPAVLLAAWFLAVRWRRAAKGSPIDFVATRYTSKMCSTLAVLGLPMQLLDNSPEHARGNRLRTRGRPDGPVFHAVHVGRPPGSALVRLSHEERKARRVRTQRDRRLCERDHWL
ncbi:MAG: hypothetical protein K6G91_07680 [Kiritimatiellae bacterium]|nr:hypothetical protein [Kiritimatiellia bacterium]